MVLRPEVLFVLAVQDRFIYCDGRCHQPLPKAIEQSTNRALGPLIMHGARFVLIEQETNA